MKELLINQPISKLAAYAGKHNSKLLQVVAIWLEKFM